MIIARADLYSSLAGTHAFDYDVRLCHVQSFNTHTYVISESHIISRLTIVSCEAKKKRSNATTE